MVVDNESAENRKHPNSVEIAAKVKYVFACLSERGRRNCSERWDMVNLKGFRAKAVEL